MADLSIEVLGLKYPNPFVLGSGPPGTNSKVIKRSFSLGWGGIVCKTISLDNSKVHNLVPRYGKLLWRNSTNKKDVVGYQNIELISDRPFDVWLDDLADSLWGLYEAEFAEDEATDLSPQIAEARKLVARWS